MGGLADGIVFRQMLQWHNMFSGWLPPATLVDTRINLFWDGVFHAALWVLTAAGIVLLFRAGRRKDVRWSGHTLFGACLAGWGLFNLIKGVVDHLLLGIHRFNEYSPDPLVWDLAFLASGGFLVLLGMVLARSSL